MRHFYLVIMNLGCLEEVLLENYKYVFIFTNVANCIAIACVVCGIILVSSSDILTSGLLITLNPIDIRHIGKCHDFSQQSELCLSVSKGL